MGLTKSGRTGVKHIKTELNINPRTGKPYYYKDNPEAVKARDARRMYVNNKEISKFDPLHTAGRYRTLEGAAFASLNNYSNVKEGYVYIVSNPAWEGWYKVGMAIDAYDRCSGYQTSSPFRDYTVEYCKYFEDRRESEQNIHTKLAEQKIERRGEWFRGSLTDIKSVIQQH
jgi:uncharacterized protein YutD